MLMALTGVLSRTEATLEWFEERMESEEVKTVNECNFPPPMMEIEKLTLDEEGVHAVMEGFFFFNGRS